MEKIYKAIHDVMNDVGAIAKSDRNPQQGYKYRGIDAVMNALQPALIKNGVCIVPQVMEQTREERKTQKGGLLIYSTIKCKYTFYAEDGSFVEAVVTGEGMDSGDKASNKAMSAAYKYACFQTFCIPTEEMVDSEKDSPEPLPEEPARGKDAQKLMAELLTAAMEKGYTKNDIREVAKCDDLSMLPLNRLEKAVEYYKAVEPKNE